MAITDFEKIKEISVVSVSGTPTISRAVPLKITSGDDSTAGTGEIVLDWTNISTQADIGIYDENDNLLNYYFESFDATAKTAVIWVYRSWVQDGTVQLKVAYGNGPSDQSVAASTVFDNETDLVAGYLFNETSGDLLDVTSNNNDGTVTGATQDATGIVDGAYSFDGTDDYIQIADNASLNCTDAITIVGWIYARSFPSAYIRIIDKSSATGALEDGYRLMLNGVDDFDFLIANGGNRYRAAVSGLDYNTWYHVVGVYDGSNVLLYIDATKTTGDAYTGTLGTNSHSLMIGTACDASTGFFDGVLDSVAIYSSALSSTEITAIYNATKAAPTFFSQKAATETSPDTSTSPPDAPTSPSPGDGCMIEYATSITLSCFVSDPDGDTLSVSFYDASDDSLIGSDSDVPSGGTASVTWDNIQPGSHSWYVEVNDGAYTTTGDTWSFTLATQMQSHLMQDTTTLAVCWYIKRTDGVEYGYTTADKTLTIDGLDYKPVNSGEPSSVKMSANLSPDNSEVEVVLDDDDISEEELRAGLFDYAQVKKFLVNYENVSLGKIKLISGRMGKITILDGRAKTEFMSLTDHLNMQIGRHILPTCDAELGDSKCGVDLASYTVSGTITSVTDNQTFTDSDRTEDDDYFTYGKITFTSGNNNGLSMDIKDFASGQFKLMESMPYDVTVGNTYEAVAGCNKEFSTCKDKFNNGVNFRGFPHLPGPMEILRYEV